jgi:hypothetical protein
VVKVIETDAVHFDTLDSVWIHAISFDSMMRTPA